jgi:uncharacterized repeat protein (TIGR04052 family)
MLSTGLILTACGGGGGSSTSVDPTPTEQTLTIPFQAVAGTTAIDCAANLTLLGTQADSGTISDFAFYVHDIKFTTTDNKTITTTLVDNNFQDPQYGVALLDFQNKADSCAGLDKPTNKQVSLKATVDPSKINGISFVVGVPETANHHSASTSRSPYNRSGLAWSWQSGHKFMRLDVKPSQQVTKANGTKTATFNFHLGSTGCSGDPVTGQVVTCTAPNRPAISLSEGFTVNTANKTSTVVLNYASLVENVNINLETGGAVGCMSGATDPECPGFFEQLNLPLGTSPAPGTQHAFSVSNTSN